MAHSGVLTFNSAFVMSSMLGASHFPFSIVNNAEDMLKNKLCNHSFLSCYRFFRGHSGLLKLNVDPETNLVTDGKRTRKVKKDSARLTCKISIEAGNKQF